MGRRGAVALLAAVAWAGAAGAHPPAGANQASGDAPGDTAVRGEVEAFRATLAGAIRARDAERLRALYAPGFSHVHGSGRIDRRDARIVSVLAGDPVIETAPADELTVQAAAPGTVVVTGRSPVLNVAEQRPYDFRWTAVYVRDAGGWRLAASQATRLPVPPPDPAPAAR